MDGLTGIVHALEMTTMKRRQFCLLPDYEGASSLVVMTTRCACGIPRRGSQHTSWRGMRVLLTRSPSAQMGPIKLLVTLKCLLPVMRPAKTPTYLKRVVKEKSDEVNSLKKSEMDYRRRQNRDRLRSRDQHSRPSHCQRSFSFHCLHPLLHGNHRHCRLLSWCHSSLP
jgi:hypothetical protein